MTSIDPYELIEWEDAPSIDTPLSAENLNHMDRALGSLYRDVQNLEEALNNLSVSDATNMNVTFGEEGEEGVDDAPLQASPSSLGDVVTGIHSRIRDIYSQLTEINTALTSLNEALSIQDVKDRITFTPGTNCGSVTVNNAILVANILYVQFTVTASTNIASGGNMEIGYSGFTPAVPHDYMIGKSVRGLVQWDAWIYSTVNNIIRCRRMDSSQWTTTMDPLGISISMPVVMDEEEEE